MLDLVKKHAPVTGDQLAEHLGVSRPTLRSDLSLLVMLGMLDAKPKVGYFLGNVLDTGNRSARLFQSITVREVMGIPVNIPDKLSVHDAVITLFTENADTLLIVNDHKRFVGIVTPKDLLKITLGNSSAAAIPISLVMTRYPNIVTVLPDDSVLSAIHKMLLHQVDCLPVINPNPDVMQLPEVAGWLSKSNIVRLMSDASAAEQGEACL
ncbi:CBS domain-containing protein [Paenibacillus protaetiae]|uniref:CBS domain-containing protein n=1 Tax=Paenibacillus protaetiae TaxID=2509456 RepID=A0A4P6F5G8_9BACL|nr:CBS domain-containing protein [Paenibacillus protaetiae]